jgi:hypothetical protein
VILGFRREVDENCALLGCYAAEVRERLFGRLSASFRMKKIGEYILKS